MRIGLITRYLISFDAILANITRDMVLKRSLSTYDFHCSQIVFILTEVHEVVTIQSILRLMHNIKTDKKKSNSSNDTYIIFTNVTKAPNDFL